MRQQFIWPSRGSNVIGLWFVPLDPLPKHAPGRFAQHDRSGGASLVRPPPARGPDSSAREPPQLAGRQHVAQRRTANPPWIVHLEGDQAALLEDQSQPVG